MLRLTSQMPRDVGFWCLYCCFLVRRGPPEAGFQPHMPYPCGRFWVRRTQRKAESLCAALASLTRGVAAKDFLTRALQMLKKIGWIAAHRFLFAGLRVHLLGWPRFLVRTAVASRRCRFNPAVDEKHKTLVLGAKRELAMVAEVEAWSSGTHAAKKLRCSAMPSSLPWCWRCCGAGNYSPRRGRSRPGSNGQVPLVGSTRELNVSDRPRSKP